MRRSPLYLHQYPDNEPEREVLIRVLEEHLADLKAGTDPSGGEEGCTPRSIKKTPKRSMMGSLSTGPNRTGALLP